VDDEVDADETGAKSAPTTRARAGGNLPAVERVRTRAEAGGAVVVAFASGAKLRCREHEDGVVEVWTGPDGDRYRQVRETDASHEEATLRTLGAYLSFDGRERAAFVWGERRVETLLGSA
jgi:hypothetical protein